jgi:Amt family ammonium transporter
VIFMLIWTTIVYDLVAHWAWSAWTIGYDENGNRIQQFGWMRDLGVLDFAGGTVVHITSGYSALAASIVVGKRKVYNKKGVRNI